MAYQMTLTLTDDEYTALSAEASRTGKPVEILVHEALQPRLNQAAIPSQNQSEQTLAGYLFHKGIVMNIPTYEPLSSEEEAELERLARAFSGGKSASEMVIEDRGPR